METQTNRDLYADLAARCYSSLQELSAQLPSSSAAQLPQAVLAFWRKLAWADFMLAKPEREIFERIFPTASHGDMGRDAEEDVLHDFLRAVAEHDAEADPKIGRKVDSQLESFGYALLAADREFSDGELEVLQVTMKRAREILYSSPQEGHAKEKTVEVSHPQLPSDPLAG